MKNNLFSIIIPTWNNLAYLKLCIRSIRQNSAHSHQIIVFVNDGSEGSLEWVQSQKLDFFYSPENVGICIAVNRCRSLVETDYIVYINDDMYVCPGWDVALWEEISQFKHNRFYFSATMIEPKGSNPAAIAPLDYGTDIESFNETGLLKGFSAHRKDDWSGASWPPSIVHKELWDIVGGFSIEFSPGMYSDPDFAVKLYKAGVREFRGIGRSRVYHFMTKTTGRIKQNTGRKQFHYKWGFSSKVFYSDILKLGKPYTGPAKEVDLSTIENPRILIRNQAISKLIRLLHK